MELGDSGMEGGRELGVEREWEGDGDGMELGGIWVGDKDREDEKE